MGPIGYPELILIFLVINMVLYLLFLELEQPSSDITLGKPPHYPPCKRLVEQ